MGRNETGQANENGTTLFSSITQVRSHLSHAGPDNSSLSAGSDVRGQFSTGKGLAHAQKHFSDSSVILR